MAKGKKEVEEVEKAEGDEADEKVDAFATLLDEEPEPDPELEAGADAQAEAGADDEEKKAAEEAAAAKAREEEEHAAADEEAEEEEHAAADDAEDEGEPEPGSIEEIAAKHSALERELYSTRRDLMKLKESKRIREEQDEIAAIEREAGEAAPQIGVVDEETGKVVLDRDALDKAVARVHARRAASEPVQDYKAFRAGLISELDEADREVGEATITEMEEGYQYLDGEIGKFCQEAGVDPAQIGGMANLLNLIERSGIGSGFDEKYPGLSIANVMVAPKSESIMRKEFAAHFERKATSKPAEEQEETTVARRRIGEKPRSMSRKGRQRVKKVATKLTDADPASLFDMPQDEFDELERNSAEDLERRG